MFTEAGCKLWSELLSDGPAYISIRREPAIFIPEQSASLSLILVWRVYLILLDIKPRVPVGSMIKNALVLINLSSDSAGGRSRCLSWRWKHGEE